MALIQCPECKKEISDTLKSCIYCGYVLSQDKNLGQTGVGKKAGSSKSRVILLIAAVCCLVTILVAFTFSRRTTGLEANAKEYVKELEDLFGKIEVTDAVCFSHISYGETEISYKYLITYTCEGEEDYALFFDGEVGYAGNGENGGFCEDVFQSTLNNANASTATLEYLEFLAGRGDQEVITAEEAAENNVEGIILLDVDKIK